MAVKLSLLQQLEVWASINNRQEHNSTIKTPNMFCVYIYAKCNSNKTVTVDKTINFFEAILIMYQRFIKV